MSAKAEYATRVMLELAARPRGQIVRLEELAREQAVPATFLAEILGALRSRGLVRSHRGRDGGYELALSADAVSIADVLRCIDGSLASVRDVRLGDLQYHGPTARLTEVWMALRASMRSVLEQTTLAHVVKTGLPEHVAELAAAYRREEAERHPRADGE